MNESKSKRRVDSPARAGTRCLRQEVGAEHVYEVDSTQPDIWLIPARTPPDSGESNAPPPSNARTREREGRHGS